MRGYIIKVTYGDGESHYYGSGPNYAVPWIYSTREAAEEVAASHNYREPVVLPVEYTFQVVNPTDPGDPIRRAITEKCEAGETR